jgi:hypothetical protein
LLIPQTAINSQKDIEATLGSIENEAVREQVQASLNCSRDDMPDKVAAGRSLEFACYAGIQQNPHLSLLGCGLRNG